MQDTTNPTIVGSRTPDANANGWNNTGVTVSFECDDTGSGIASCSGPTTLTGEGAGQSETGTAVDNAGNSAQATVGGINIDKTAPTILGGNAGTYTIDQTVVSPARRRIRFPAWIPRTALRSTRRRRPSVSGPTR